MRAGLEEDDQGQRRITELGEVRRIADELDELLR